MRPIISACAFLVFISCMLAAQTNPVPFINQPLVPATVAPDSGGFTLTVHGAGFTPTAVVEWNGSQRQTVVVSNTLLQATINASDVGKAPHTASVTVVNLGSQNTTSNVTYFTVRKAVSTEALIADPNFPTRSLIIASGDFNNDGNLDAVVDNLKGTSRLVIDAYLGDGKGNFQSPIETVFKKQSKIGQPTGMC
jgi:hypothetical protein